MVEKGRSGTSLTKVKPKRSKGFMGNPPTRQIGDKDTTRAMIKDPKHNGEDDFQNS
jgi:hypothetical protein